jgi:hypothetical protein
VERGPSFPWGKRPRDLPSLSLRFRGEGSRYIHRFIPFFRTGEADQDEKEVKGSSEELRRRV